MDGSVSVSAENIVDELLQFIDDSVVTAGDDTKPIDPGHRIPFPWPPHPVSADYHVLASDWTARASFEAYGQTYEVLVAQTALGYFGRCEKFWNEAKAESLEEMLVLLKDGTKPVFDRQFAIGETIGLEGRYDGALHDLKPIDLVKLLYCLNRDVAHEAHTLIETRASSGLYSEALREIMLDRRHKARRIAQWCVLDMFEDLPAFFSDSEGQRRAVEAVCDLIWEAEDDYARTIYKAGVVLGGHICTEPAADALIACIDAPSKVGRRSAIHAVFHLAEWMPARKGQILTALRNASANDDEPLLREFAQAMVKDIEAGAIDHKTEPLFADEA